MNENELKPGLTEPATEPSQTTTAGVTAVNAYSGQPDDLHDLFGDAAGEDDDPLAALRGDPNYAALIRDLEYIATQARLLFEPAEEAPSDELWTKIQSKLGEEPPLN